MFDVYIRVSRVGDRSDENLRSPEQQEAAAREWAARHGVDVGEVVEELDVSGGTAVEERALERLVSKVEAGDSKGIITSKLDRFGRDLIGGALALKRITEAAGRLVCVEDGFDSASPGSELMFNLRMAIAQDYLSRTRTNFRRSAEDAAKRGVYLARCAPFGYKRKDAIEPQYGSQGRLIKDGTLVVDEREAELVREMFRRRAEGVKTGALVRFLADEGAVSPQTGKPRTKAGVLGILKNRAYVGEATVQSGRKGHPTIIKDHHEPILTEAEWQAAQGKGDVYYPRIGTVNQLNLLGLVYCATCAKRCRSGARGEPGQKRGLYVCTNPDCAAHASMMAAKLDGYVEDLLWRDLAAHEPHVEAVILGDTRYGDALAAVERAQREHDEFRDNLELQRELGMEGFVKGLRVRKGAVQLARRELARIRPPAGGRNRGERVTFEQFLREDERERLAKFIDRVVLKPAGRVGKHVPLVEERVEVYWAGATKPAKKLRWTAAQRKLAESIRAASDISCQIPDARESPPLGRASSVLRAAKGTQ
jgi:DNA invertase Pin-like site-specific DNA recombinase